MADAISPPLAASMPLVTVPMFATFLSDVGLDPARMVAGLVGVIIVQTLLPRSAVGWKAIAGLAGGSMLFASFAAPFAYSWLLKKSPTDVDWLYNVDPKHLKAVIAGCLGGAAQPLLLLIKATASKYLAKHLPAPPVEEPK
jgi:hypothetical protein